MPDADELITIADPDRLVAEWMAGPAPVTERVRAHFEKLNLAVDEARQLVLESEARAARFERERDAWKDAHERQGGAVQVLAAQRAELMADVERMRVQLDELRVDSERLCAALDAPPYVDCLCPGCPRKVPQAWVSGMCQPCGAEDCEHTDGARAVAQALEPTLANVEAVAEAIFADHWGYHDDDVPERRESLPPWPDVDEDGAKEQWRSHARAALSAVRIQAGLEP